MCFKTDHPECQEDELYLGNFAIDGTSAIGWTSKRIGKVAYNNDGKSLEVQCPELLPVFIKKDEVRKRHPKLMEELGD